MKQYESYNGGSTSLTYYKRCVEEICNNVGVPIPDYNTITRYYFSKIYSPVDVFRMTNNELKIKGAKVTIEWTDQYGHGSRDFTSAKQIRKFFEDFPVLKDQLQKGVTEEADALQTA